MFDYDVCIIGGGILGCMAARNLMRFRLKGVLIEKREDVCCGITRANTAIVYPGYDNKPGTLKSQMCVKGNASFTELCNDLQVPLKRCGSLMICHGPKGARVLEKKYQNGLQNQVPDMQLLSGREVLRLEPALSPAIYQGLYAPTAGTLQPWELGIAAFENARDNGCGFLPNSEVVSIKPLAGGFLLSLRHTANHSLSTLRVRGILNCAGLRADSLRELLLQPSVRIFPQKADYVVFDRSVEGILQHIIFEEPEEKGKGLTLVPTVSGNLLAGPSMQPACDRESFASTAEGLEFVRSRCQALLPSLPLEHIIRNFSSLRPNPFDVTYQADQGYVRSDRSINSFVIDQSSEYPGFLSLIGIKTPGLTCSDELTRYALERILSAVGPFGPNPDFNPRRTAIPRLHKLAPADRDNLIGQNRDYGKIVCHCQDISEGEIREAIRRGAVTVDGVKRRCETGMGPCQGSRCTIRIMQILSEMLQVPISQVRQGNQNTYICSCPTPHKDEKAAPANENMQFTKYDLLIVGGGAAGMSAAIHAWEKNPSLRILLSDRETRLGGILPQCIHSGFGKSYFGEMMTGPQYAARLEKRLSRTAVTVCMNTEVIKLLPDKTAWLSGPEGLKQISFDRVILAAGCRERAPGSMNICGTRPSGIFTAGQLQKMINLHHYDPGNCGVIMGSGDIGLIMARRLMLTGKKVGMITEILDQSPAMARNIRLCLKPWQIPLRTRSAVVQIHGVDRITGVTIRNLDTGAEETIPCDFLVAASGLIPDQALIEDWGDQLPDWIHLCGNCDHVHPIVDGVSLHAEHLIDTLYP